MQVHYDGDVYEFDLEDIDMEQIHVMEKFGVPNLKALEEGLATGDLAALTVAFWVMTQQSGHKTRIEAVKFKPIKFIKALGEAALKQQAADAPKDED